MNSFIQIWSSLTDEKLIISDEFETKAEAVSYRDLFIKTLINRMNNDGFENLTSWFEKAFAIEIIQANSHPEIQTKEVYEAFSFLHGDVERVVEFMNHAFSAAEDLALQEEIEYMEANPSK